MTLPGAPTYDRRVPASQESRFVSVVRFAFRSSKRIAVTVVGGVLVLVGLALLVLPGPGIVVVGAGFAVLGTQYAWAAAALDLTIAKAERAGRMAKDVAGGAAGRLRRRKRASSVPVARRRRAS